MEIVSRTENKLLSRVEIDFKWNHKGSKTPSKKEVMDLVKTLEPGSNPDFIVVTGGSAGGHLSSLLALSSAAPEFVDAKNSEFDWSEQDLTVQGCVPFYGIYDLLDERKLQKSVGLDIIMRKSIIKETKIQNPDLYKLISPVSHIGEHAPPFLIVHGDKDSLTLAALLLKE